MPKVRQHFCNIPQTVQGGKQLRRIALNDEALEIVLTGLTMLGAFTSRVVIPYRHIETVWSRLRVPPRLLRLGGTSIGPIHEGHYLGEDGWYFLSYENPDRVITLDLRDFRWGRHLYCGAAIEVDDPVTMAAAIKERLSTH
jgi:hypothetical protein